MNMLPVLARAFGVDPVAFERQVEAYENQPHDHRAPGPLLGLLREARAHIIDVLPYTLRPLGRGVPRYSLRIDVEYESAREKGEADA